MWEIDRKSIIDALSVVREFVCAYSPSKGCDCKVGLSSEIMPRCRDGGFDYSRFYGSEFTGCPELRAVIGVLESISDEEWRRLQNGSACAQEGVDGKTLRLLQDLATMIENYDSRNEATKVTQAIPSFFAQGIRFALSILEGRVSDVPRAYAVGTMLEMQSAQIRHNVNLFKQVLLRGEQEMQEFLTAVDESGDGEEEE